MHRVDWHNMTKLQLFSVSWRVRIITDKHIMSTDYFHRSLPGSSPIVRQQQKQTSASNLKLSGATYWKHSRDSGIATIREKGRTK